VSDMHLMALISDSEWVGNISLSFQVGMK